MVYKKVHDFLLFEPNVKRLLGNFEEIENNIIQGLYITIERFYNKLFNENYRGNDLFLLIIDEIVKSISNKLDVDYDRLTFYITLIVCYVFWECEVFERP